MRVRIHFNGREYASLADMPAEERRRYEEAMQSLGPLMTGTGGSVSTDSFGAGDGTGIHTTVRTRIVVNGREYASPDELPPDLRRHYDEAMRNAGTGVRAPGRSVTISVTSSGGSTGFDQPGAVSRPSLMYTDPDPGTIVARFTGRALLAVASLFAIGVAVWLLYEAGLIGPH